jgi:nucleotide-binding universal stress UspA family protein
MNVLFGIEREADPAASLLNCLQLPDASVDIVHVVAPINYILADPIHYVTFGIEPAQVDQMVAEQIAEGNESVTAAMLALEKKYACRSRTLFGQPAQEILNYAEQHPPDLIAVNAAHTHSEGVALLTKSVASALIMGGAYSVLIARTFLPTERPLRIVFATDHSPYANRCFERFLTLAPAGMEHLAIVSAYPKSSLQAMQNSTSVHKISIIEAVCNELSERSASLIARAHERLPDYLFTASSQVVPEPVESAIDHAMKGEQGDLLVLGARGHNLTERLLMGSVSTHQAIAGKYSTLIMRD